MQALIVSDSCAQTVPAQVFAAVVCR